MKENLISVVMASFNGERFLTQQLESIIWQDYKNFELIIVDDNSWDSSLSIIKHYALEYPHLIKVYQNSVNLGVTRTFLKAISLTNGQFIAFSDQDDIWLPNKLSMLRKNIGNNLLIHSDAQLINSQDETICSSFSHEYKNMFSRYSDYLIENNVTGCTAMISRELIDIIGEFPLKLSVHDHYFAIVAAFLEKIYYLDLPLVQYRQHGNNLIGVEVNQEKRLYKLKLHLSDLELMVKSKLFKHNHDMALAIEHYKCALGIIGCSLRLWWWIFVRLGKFKAFKYYVKYVISKYVDKELCNN